MKLEWLDDEEIFGLTGRKTRPAQIKQLRHLGINHGVRSDGTIAVLKSHVAKIYGGITDMARPAKRTSPNWAEL